VHDEEGELHECRACGRFRKEQIVPLIGDRVVFDRQEGILYGFINEILPRKNFLVRPAVANVDGMIIVLSADKPKADLMLCDKLILQAVCRGIVPLVCINKMESSPSKSVTLKKQYREYGALCVSAHVGTGMKQLGERIRGKCICLVGQSAVGKSSIINILEGTNRRKTGDLSRKTGQGKHTTRVAELSYLAALDAYLLDTPGFSMLDMNGIEKKGVLGCYREFFAYNEQCRFSGCAHINEPDCAVKRAVEEGRIDRGRYERYLKILDCLEDK
jgi:ribosome biogenesis GTPase